MSKKIGIILVNYKDYAERFLGECRDSLRAQIYPADDFKVYIVDNASSAESSKYLADNYPEAKIIPRADGNYSAANNAGIAAARSDGADIFVIANMDAAYDPFWLSELVKGFGAGADVGLVQSKILLYQSGSSPALKINSLGNYIHFLGFGFTSGYGEADREIDGYPEISGYASGCSLAITKEAFDTIGGYDEEYYMYHDDLEMGWKAKLAGYRIVLAPKSVCYHKYEFSRSVRMLYYMERNRLLVILTFYEFTSILAVLPIFILMELGMIFYSIINRWLPIKARAYGYFLRPSSWNKILAARQRVKAFRKRRDREIVDDLTGRILFQEINNPILEKIANPLLNWYWALARKVIKG